LEIRVLVLPFPQDGGQRVGQRYPWGRETIIVHDRALDASYARHAAPLSIKTVLSGEERYYVHGFPDIISKGRHLILNDGEEYESEVEGSVESLCVFFSKEDVACVQHSTLSYEIALTSPDGIGRGLEFVSVGRSADNEVSRLIVDLVSLAAAPRLAQQEATLKLLAAMRASEESFVQRAQRFDAVQAGTRKELLRRCHIGLAFLESCYEQDITLDQLARLAGMSKMHFVRAFRACFDETPYQALKRIRLERAASHLRAGRTSVSEVALAVGYTNFSAFARAFRRHHGLPPSSLR
jgi:AraC family transcriptional regulator